MLSETKHWNCIKMNELPNEGIHMKTILMVIGMGFILSSCGTPVGLSESGVGKSDTPANSDTSKTTAKKSNCKKKEKSSGGQSCK